MTRQELEILASEKPAELALLFAQKVTGDKHAVVSTWEDSRDIQIMKNKSYQTAQRMLTDWTAVIKAGKKAGLNFIVDFDTMATAWYLDDDHNIKEIKCYLHEDEWPDCAALMIVMIEVMETI